MSAWFQEHASELLLGTNAVTIIALAGLHGIRTWLYDVHKKHAADLDLSIGLLKDHFRNCLRRMLDLADDGRGIEGIARSQEGSTQISLAAKCTRHITALKATYRWLHRALQSAEILCGACLFTLILALLALALGATGGPFYVALSMVLTLVIVIVLLVVAAAVLDAVFMQTVRTVRAMDLDSRPRGAAEESIDAGS